MKAAAIEVLLAVARRDPTALARAVDLAELVVKSTDAGAHGDAQKRIA